MDKKLREKQINQIIMNAEEQKKECLDFASLITMPPALTDNEKVWREAIVRVLRENAQEGYVMGIYDPTSQKQVSVKFDPYPTYRVAKVLSIHAYSFLEESANQPRLKDKSQVYKFIIDNSAEKYTLEQLQKLNKEQIVALYVKAKVEYQNKQEKLERNEREQAEQSDGTPAEPATVEPSTPEESDNHESRESESGTSEHFSKENAGSREEYLFGSEGHGASKEGHSRTDKGNRK